MNEQTCNQETLEDCEIADCCPICFGETQAALTCQFTLTNGTSLCDTTCQCDDVVDWEDADGFNCAWYGEVPEDRCPKFGDANTNDGEIANTACCACKLLVPSGAAANIGSLLAVVVGAMVSFLMM